MPSRRDLLRLRQANGTIVTSARRELSAFVAMLPGDSAAARLAAAEFFPALIRSYGDVGAAVAAEWFEEVARGNEARVVLGDVLPDEQLAKVVEWAADGDLARRLGQAAQRLILAPGRSTIRRSAHASGARFARVPTKPDPCAWCLMLASRGAVYLSEETAERDGDGYHDDCGCEATPIWPGEALPAGYDPEAMYALYQSARSEVGGVSPSTGGILAAMREMHDLR